MVVFRREKDIYKLKIQSLVDNAPEYPQPIAQRVTLVENSRRCICMRRKGSKSWLRLVASSKGILRRHIPMYASLPVE